MFFVSMFGEESLQYLSNDDAREVSRLQERQNAVEACAVENLRGVECAFRSSNRERLAIRVFIISSDHVSLHRVYESAESWRIPGREPITRLKESCVRDWSACKSQRAGYFTTAYVVP